MPLLGIHTHCQVAQIADTQIKTCQRVWLPQTHGRQNNGQHTTWYIKNWAESSMFRVKTINQRCLG
ncbi:hypothetical protein ES708_19541 [subsurface metagenome]